MVRHRFTTSVVMIVTVAAFLLAGCTTKTATQTETKTSNVSSTASPSKSATTASPATTTTTTANPTTSTKVPSVKIGGLLPFTGNTAGEEMSRGMKYAVDAINKAGGIKSLGGAQLEMVWGDHKSDPKVGLTEAERLMTLEKVVAVVGLASSPVGQAIIPDAEKYQIPLLDVAGAGDVIYPMKTSWWRTLGPASTVASTDTMNALFAMIKDNKVKADRIALVNPNSAAFTAALNNVQLPMLKQAGLEQNIVFNQQFDPTAADLTGYVLKLKAANPDVIVGANSSGDMVNFVKALYSTGFQPTVWTSWSPSIFAPNLLSAMGPQLVDAVVHQPGVFAIVGYSEATAAGYKPLGDFSKSYKAWAPTANLAPDIDDWVVEGAQGIYVIAKALEKSGSRDPAKLNDALRSFNLAYGDPSLIIPTFNPSLGWDETGKLLNAHPSVGEWIKETGRVEIVFPANLRTHEPWLK